MSDFGMTIAVPHLRKTGAPSLPKGSCGTMLEGPLEEMLMLARMHSGRMRRLSHRGDAAGGGAGLDALLAEIGNG